MCEYEKWNDEIFYTSLDVWIDRKYARVKIFNLSSMVFSANWKLCVSKEFKDDLSEKEQYKI